MKSSDERPLSDAEKRFTNGLIYDVASALEKHGYKCASVASMGRFVGDLLRLTETFEGKVHE